MTRNALSIGVVGRRANL